MTTFAFGVTVSGLDLDDSRTLEDLIVSADFPLVASENDGVCTFDVEIEAGSGEDALQAFTEYLSAFPSVSIDRVSEDLVNTSEIASRLDVSREAVRTWVRGVRGPSGFPLHRHVIGGQKVWAWSTVYAWAVVTRSIPSDLPEPIDVSCIDWFNGTHKLRRPGRSASPEGAFLSDRESGVSGAMFSMDWGSHFSSLTEFKVSVPIVERTSLSFKRWAELSTFRPEIFDGSPPAYQAREGGTYVQALGQTIRRDR